MQRMVAALLALTGLAQASCLGCIGDSKGQADQVARLRARFPSRAPAVLGEAGAAIFVASPVGFVARPRTNTEPTKAADASLARRGCEASLSASTPGEIQFKFDDGFTVRVREEKARQQARVEGGAVVYPRENGAAFWTALHRGFEEWLFSRFCRFAILKKFRNLAAFAGENFFFHFFRGFDRVAVG